MGKRSPRTGRPPRVTLDFTGPPLRLPGEHDPAAAEVAPALNRAGAEVAEDRTSADGKPVLSLPPGADLLRRPPSRDPRVGDEGARDGWVSSREAPLDPPDGPASSSSAATGPESGPSPGEPSSRPPGLRAVPTTRPAPVLDRRRSPSTDAIDLVEQSGSAPPEADLASEMADRSALRHSTGALSIAELLLGQRPDDEHARRYAEGSRQRLAQFYTARLGPLDRVPDVAVPESEIRWLGLDHQAAFLLSRVDGRSTVEEILHVVPMPHLDALKSLVELLDERVISLRDP